MKIPVFPAGDPQFSSVQWLSHVWLFATPWIAACQASLSITNSRSLLKLMPIKSVMPSSHLILCRPLLLLPPNPPSIRVFSNESTLCMRWPKYWSFSFSISPSNEHPGLIYFRMDWLDLLAVQGTLKSLLQHHSSKASIFRCSAFFTVQVSHPYMTTGKTIASTGDPRHLKILSTLGSEPLNQCGQWGLNTESGANVARFRSSLECHQKGFSTERLKKLLICAVMSADLCSKELALTIYNRRVNCGERKQERLETFSNKLFQCDI